jgi:dihydroorotase
VKKLVINLRQKLLNWQKNRSKTSRFPFVNSIETELFRNDIPLKDKKITAEVCVHHLTFTNEDYETKGGLIKWNPAVKTQKDKDGLWEAFWMTELM